MSKGLEALKELKNRYGKNFSIQDDKRIHVIEKELKALEIIKEKRVDLTTLYFCFEKYDLEAFNNALNYAIGEKPLTQEEYDLLKEVLL